MSRKCFSIGIGCLLFLLILMQVGCEALGFYTVTVTNRTSAVATFTMDNDPTQELLPNQYVKIGRVQSGEHTWRATWTDERGRSRMDSGTIDVDEKIEMVITPDGIQ